MDQIKKILDTIKSSWRKQSKKGRRILLTAVVGILVVSLVIVYLMNMTKYTVLYADLDSDEASEVTSLLKSDGYDYKLKDNTIYVTTDDESTVRVELANQGYPKSGLNYDFFLENVDMMTTSDERKLIERYQLNKTLASVIKSISGIKEATVNISVPNTSDYVLSSNDDDSSKASAAVTVTLSPGKELSDTQVNGIKTLVAKSVPNLSTEDVAVVDTATGNALGDGDSTVLSSSSLKSEVEKNYEDYITKNIKKILTPIYGNDAIEIAVKSKIDIDKKIQEVITYQPSENNTGVVSSESSSSSQSTDGSTSGGTVGTGTNTESGDDTTTYSGVESEGGTYYITSEKTYEYLVSKITEQIQKDSGELEDLTISIAIDQDGIDDETMANIKQLSANAAGVTTDKIAIAAYKFSNKSKDTAATTTTSGDNTDAASPLEGLWLYLAIGGGALLLVLMLLMILLKKRGKKKKKLAVAELPADSKARLTQQTASNALSAIELREMQELQELKDAKGLAVKKEIQDFSGRNPEIAAQLVRSWLRGEDGDG